MGYNTVLVVYNDTVDWGAKDPDIGKRIHLAVRSWSDRHRDRSQLDIIALSGGGGGASYGQVCSQAHADYDQVVVVGQNRGRPLEDCTDLGVMTQRELAEALIKHGWTVKPPKRPRSSALCEKSE